MEEKYLNSSDIIINIPDINTSVEDLISADNYNEQKILLKILNYQKDEIQLLLRCAIQISIIGAGNKNYGFIRDLNGNVVEIVTIFDKYRILYNKNINERYKEDDLSARRLVRFFRLHIQKFIEKTNRPSYLWLKYSDKNVDYIRICFPGAEHLVTTKEEANYIMNAYKNLDRLLGTKFMTRLERVFIARGLYTFKDVI